MILRLPLQVSITRKTRQDRIITLNLNTFRNLHFHVLNQAKIAWKGVVERSLADTRWSMPPAPYLFTYTVFPANLRAFDLGNVAPAIQKFTDDALQELGVIENDNIKFIKAINYRLGWVMKDNPHCELRIEEWREG